MPDTFADWQDRVGLVRPVDAAAALGISRQSVHLRKGRFKPHPSTLRLMAVLEWCRERGEMPPISFDSQPRTICTRRIKRAA